VGNELLAAPAVKPPAVGQVSGPAGSGSVSLKVTRGKGGAAPVGPSQLMATDQ